MKKVYFWNPSLNNDYDTRAKPNFKPFSKKSNCGLYLPNCPSQTWGQARPLQLCTLAWPWPWNGQWLILKTLPKARHPMNRLSEGYRRAVDQNGGRKAKIVFLGKKQYFGPKKNVHLLILTRFWQPPEKVVQRKKYPFPNKYQSLSKFWKKLFGK